MSTTEQETTGKEHREGRVWSIIRRALDTAQQPEQSYERRSANLDALASRVADDVCDAIDAARASLALPPAERGALGGGEPLALVDAMLAEKGIKMVSGAEFVGVNREALLRLRDLLTAHPRPPVAAPDDLTVERAAKALYEHDTGTSALDMPLTVRLDYMERVGVVLAATTPPVAAPDEQRVSDATCERVMRVLLLNSQVDAMKRNDDLFAENCRLIRDALGADVPPVAATGAGVGDAAAIKHMILEWWESGDDDVLYARVFGDVTVDAARAALPPHAPGAATEA